MEDQVYSEAAGQSATTKPKPVNLDGVPKEYDDVTDVFSKSKASILADHCPCNPKITLEEGASPPPSPPWTNLLVVSGGATHPP